MAWQNRVIAALSRDCPFVFWVCFCFVAFGFPSPCLFMSCNLSLIANMAPSFSRQRTIPERSRSRDDHMWQNRRNWRAEGQQHQWPEQPPPARQEDWQRPPRPEPLHNPNTRKVLVIADIDGIRTLMNTTHDYSMESTRCEALPRLTRMEERALFTYNVLLNPYRLEHFTVYNLLHCISQHIWYTWDRFLAPASMDIRWQDDTGDTFVLHNEEYLVTYLDAYRPHWKEGQEHSEILPQDIQEFTSHTQPYIMRVSCHAALPNRNMLP